MRSGDSLPNVVRAAVLSRPSSIDIMAGKRQHYLPQLLLRGFSSRTQGKKEFVWYFRQGASPTEVSIRDIALSKEFYGDWGPGSLDDMITNKEQQVAEVITRARRSGQVSTADLGLLIEFVESMVIRTKHTRTGLTNAGSAVVEMISCNLSDPGKMTRFLKDYMDKEKENFRDQVRSAIQNELGEPNPFLEELVIRWVEENADEFVNALAGPGSQLVVQAYGQFLDDVEKQGERIHQESLKRAFKKMEPSERLRRYSELKWSIRRFNPGAFVLGDVGVLEMDPESETFYPAIANKAKDGILMLPIAHDSLLVGAARRDPMLPSPDEVNANSVEMSADFFVCL